MALTTTSGAPALRDGLTADLNRPRVHFLPPANWMNDPNGPIFHNGWYHLFYQHNPFGDVWGHIHWGHARSRDLVHWEHLPIALYPLHEDGEEHCYSGCATIDDQGRPLLIYTSVPFGQKEPGACYAQWAAVGDADLLTWQRHPANPILALDTYGGPALAPDWRDPFIFVEEGRTFLVLGANTADRANVLLFEAVDASRIRWRYCGILYSRPRPQTQFLECPNFFKVDGKWVLLVSPYRNIEYVVGSFDLQTLTFQPEVEGVLDPGQRDVPNFYASNILFDPQDRCILFGWVRGFAPGRGWNGCLALPRVLTIGADGRPRQAFLPELQQLRQHATTLIGARVPDGTLPVDGIFPATLEAEVVFSRGDADAAGIRFVDAGDDRTVAQIRFTGTTLAVQDTVVPLAVPPGESLRVHLYLDGSVLEVLAGDGSVAVTRLVDAAPELRVELFAEGGSAEVARLSIWTLASIA